MINVTFIISQENWLKLLPNYVDTEEPTDQKTLS